MRTEHEGIIAGMIFGDAFVSYRHRLTKDKDGIPKYPYTTSAIVIGHSIKQLEYATHKRDVLHGILGGKKSDIDIFDHYLPATGKHYRSCRFQKTDKRLRLIHPKFYINGKKTYTAENLQLLTPEGIAYWHMDDGSIGFNKNKTGDISSIYMTISTYCSENEAKLICEYFDKVYNIDARIGYEKSKRSHIIRFNTRQSKDFAKLIAPYVIPSMEYKIAQALI